MDFLSGDFDHLSQNDEIYQKNFESSYNSFERNSVLFHTLQYLIHVKEEIDHLPASAKGITAKNLKQIRPDDTATSLSKLIAHHYQQLIDQKPQGQTLDDSDIFLLIFRTFKCQIFTAVLFFHIDVVFRLAFSVFILMLFQAVEGGNKVMAYLLVGVLTIVWYLSQLFKQLGMNSAYLLSIRIKSALAMLLYAKLSKLSSYVLNVSEHRYKIPNLIANVLTIIEQRTAIILQISVFPAMIIGITVILYLRIGWPCFVGIALILLVVPIIITISSKKSEYLFICNQFKDKRTQITTQLVEGINYIKMNGWELDFQRLIKNARDEEVTSFKKLAFLRAVQRGIGNSIGLISALVMFIIASVTTGLTTPRIFSVMEIRTNIKNSVMFLVMGIGLYYQTKIILNRFAIIFNIEQKSMIRVDQELARQTDAAGNSIEVINPGIIIESDQRLGPAGLNIEPKRKRERNLKMHNMQAERRELKQGTIKLVNFRGYWKKQFDSPALYDINYQFESPKLYCITGKIGSGKSGLLQAIFGEIPYYSGKLSVNGSVAYVQQGAIVFSQSIKNNILFGREYNKVLYERAIKMSCLASDLQKLADRDNTIIGEKGVNLSGGEKIRLALARAVYSQADIYLFDHPLASVDYKVAKKIFNRCIQPLSKQKLVILVTHRTTLLKSCDELIVMDGGTIIDHGTPEQVGARNGLWKTFIQTGHVISEDEDQEENMPRFSMIKRFIDHLQDSHYENTQNDQTKDAHALLQENENTTKVSSSTYSRFFFADKLNYLLLPLSLIVLIASEVIMLVFLRILADYKNVLAGNSDMFGDNFKNFWGILGFLALSNLIFLAIKQFLVNMCIVISTTNVHQSMIKSLLRIPSSFYDETPSGILINKFTTDLGVLDNSLVVAFIDAVVGPILIVVAIINMVYENPYFVIPAGLLSAIIVAFFIYSRTAFVACKLLDLANKGPLFHFYNETIYGLTQLRLYNRRQTKMKQFTVLVNKSIKSSIAFDQVSRGFGFYEAIAALFLMAAGMSVGIEVLPPYSAANYGVATLYFISVCQSLQWVLRQIITVQSCLVSAQRIMQFQLFPRQKDLRTQYDKSIGLAREVEAAENKEVVMQEWPEKNTIEIDNLCFKYKSSLPNVLNSISFQIQHNQKVAIVGRSGAGKSSILRALFRMVQPQTGCRYEIGGYNALEMGLHSLRQHLSVIHQNPFLFRGTLSQNLDPSGTIPDQILWQALQDTNLKTKVQNLPKQLKTEISDKSQSFSMGQKQMLCLARILLSKNKFLILDEATSNLDPQTDAYINSIIREKFKETTVLAVAHRLDTVVDYDKIIVVEKGLIVEEGDPYDLIREKGRFYNMIQHSGKTEAEHILREIRNKYKSKRISIKSIN